MWDISDHKNTDFRKFKWVEGSHFRISIYILLPANATCTTEQLNVSCKTRKSAQFTELNKIVLITCDIHVASLCHCEFTKLSYNVSDLKRPLHTKHRNVTYAEGVYAYGPLQKNNTWLF